MYDDLLPSEANAAERLILIGYCVFGIFDPKDLAKFIGHKHTSEVYRCMKKYRGRIADFAGNTHRGVGAKTFSELE